MVDRLIFSLQKGFNYFEKNPTLDQIQKRRKLSELPHLHIENSCDDQWDSFKLKSDMWIASFQQQIHSGEIMSIEEEEDQSSLMSEDKENQMSQANTIPNKRQQLCPLKGGGDAVKNPIEPWRKQFAISSKFQKLRISDRSRQEQTQNNSLNNFMSISVPKPVKKQPLPAEILHQYSTPTQFKSPPTQGKQQSNEVKRRTTEDKATSTTTETNALTQIAPDNIYIQEAKQPSSQFNTQNANQIKLKVGQECPLLALKRQFPIIFPAGIPIMSQLDKLLNLDKIKEPWQQSNDCKNDSLTEFINKNTYDLEGKSQYLRQQYGGTQMVSSGLVGSLTKTERRVKVERYWEKKKNRKWKSIRYGIRKNLADQRLRVQGRFIKQKNPRFNLEMMDAAYLRQLQQESDKIRLIDISHNNTDNSCDVQTRSFDG